MEKYARQAVSEGAKNADDLHVGGDSELYRVLNLHYNRNNHIEVWGPQVRGFLFHCERTMAIITIPLLFSPNKPYIRLINTSKQHQTPPHDSLYSNKINVQ